MTKAEQKRLERIHILRTLSHYGPLPAADVARIANEECDDDRFDPLPEINPRGITMKLQGLSVAGLARGAIRVAAGPIWWEITERGRTAAFLEKDRPDA